VKNEAGNPSEKRPPLCTPAKYVAGVLHYSIPLQFASSDWSATHIDGGSSMKRSDDTRCF
jgi:hypothetical protein